MGITGKRIYLVDDEPEVLSSVSRTLRAYHYNVMGFTNAEDCLRQLRKNDCDLLIVGVKTPDMDGVALLHETKEIAPLLPVIIVAGYADIPLAVSVMKAGAVDFIKRPFNRKHFIRKVEDALTNHRHLDPMLGDQLTRVQKRILELILSGRSNKRIAYILGRSVRTIESHRGKIMRKLGVANIVDLVKKAYRMDLNQSSEEGE